MRYGKHPSVKLKELYKINPHQGAFPPNAKILFLGRDANWKENIESEEFFSQISEYLENGVVYWQKYGIHHPFLHNDYNGDGKRYHKIFSKLNISKSKAEYISFIELLPFPTFGMSKRENKLFREYLLSEENINHLEVLGSLFEDKNKIIFLAWGVLDDLKYVYEKLKIDSYKQFYELDKSKLNIKSLNHWGNIYIHKHFSDSISNETLNEMKSVIDEILAD